MPSKVAIHDIIKSPFVTDIKKVLPEWIDYNGHMNVAYYTLAFDEALDDFLNI